MGKSFTFIICFLGLVGLVHCDKDTFNVEGKVYCDTCRILFPTKVSPYLANVEVELNCKVRENGTVTFTMRGKTEKDGSYKLAIPGDHEDEICEVAVVSSPDPNCNEIVSEISNGRVPLDNNSGIESTSRYVNPIGVRQKTAGHDCLKVLDELGFVPLKDIHD